MWKRYNNGNYKVMFNLENGTKIRQTDDDKFIPSFPENCDVLISSIYRNGNEFEFSNKSRNV